MWGKKMQEKYFLKENGKPNTIMIHMKHIVLTKKGEMDESQTQFFVRTKERKKEREKPHLEKYWLSYENGKEKNI